MAIFGFYDKKFNHYICHFLFIFAVFKNTYERIETHKGILRVNSQLKQTKQE